MFPLSLPLSFDHFQPLPQRFAAVIMRIRDPKTTALIFASGKMVVTGAKSEDDSKLASRKYARIIQKLGFNAKFTEFKIQNIVGSCDVKFPIRLEGLAYSHGHFSSVSINYVRRGKKSEEKERGRWIKQCTEIIVDLEWLDCLLWRSVKTWRKGR
jgi:hypothetical protein